MHAAGLSTSQARWEPIYGRARGVCSCAFWTRLLHPDRVANLFEFFGVKLRDEPETAIVLTFTRYVKFFIQNADFSGEASGTP
ncbi:hypothetical protein AGR13a_Cc180029 [Agrobacterium genomosp. 13 str. CFBP 6927]|uniref:Uncharacterized protein n=1 Tax=Agrobacterium genomosp. 13 str. CFBP 6927 TaxID=1183428 RepID=A0ABP2BG10_9HYPH|nr:hypothetical protein AGR13a_Cc180029 [Agrobacterium genomosp. 13 str. CFBP 6927]